MDNMHMKRVVTNSDFHWHKQLNEINEESVDSSSMSMDRSQFQDQDVTVQYYSGEN